VDASPSLRAPTCGFVGLTPPPSPSPGVLLPTIQKRPAFPTTGSPVNPVVVRTAVSVVASTTPQNLSHLCSRETVLGAAGLKSIATTPLGMQFSSPG